MHFERRESFSSSAITPSCVLISQHVPHESDSKGHPCVMRTWLRFATVRKKKQTKPEFQLGCFPWKARVITRRWMQLLNNFETFFVICCVTARTKKCIIIFGSTFLSDSLFLTCWSGGNRASERGIWRPEVRYLMGTQNLFFVPHSWQDEKHLSLFLYRAKNLHLPFLLLFS